MIYVKRFEDLFLFLFLNDGEFVLPVLVPPKYGLKEFFRKTRGIKTFVPYRYRKCWNSCRMPYDVTHVNRQGIKRY